MKKTLFVFIVIVGISAHAAAQSIGMKLGTTVHKDVSVLYNLRAEVMFSYPLSNKFDVTLTTGYHRVHLDKYSFTYPAGDWYDFETRSTIYRPARTETDPAITHHFIPVVAGVKFSFTKNTFAPYLTVEAGNIYGLTSRAELTARYGVQHAGDFDSEGMVRLGCGIAYRYRENLIFDFSAKALHESVFQETIELMAGIILPL